MKKCLQNLGILASVVLLSGCAKIWGPVKSNSSVSAVTLQLNVQEVYSSHGANWMDYVKNDGTDIFSGTDTACAGTETGYAACLHGGQMRKVVLNGVSSCTGLTLTDALGVFVWTCAVKNGTATFFNIDFQPGKGLQNLVNSIGWNDNSVSLSGFQPGMIYSGSSANSVWGWTNPVTPLTDNHLLTDSPVLLSASGTVYTLASSRGSEGYDINTDKIAVVTLPGVTMNYSGKNNPAWCNGNTISIICDIGFKYIWIEGNYDGYSNGNTDSNEPVRVASSNFNRVHLLNVKNSLGNGLGVYAASNSIFDQIKASNNMNSGFGLASSTTCLMKQVISSGNSLGFIFSNVAGPGCDSNVVYQLNTSNDTGGCILYSSGSTNNSVIQAIGNNCGVGTAGIDISNPPVQGNIISQATLNNSTFGIYYNSSALFDHNTLNNIVTANNTTGISIDSSTPNNTFSQIVATDSTGDGIFDRGDNIKFTGVMLVGNNGTDCNIPSGTNPGLINATCTDTGADGSSSYTGQLSNSILRTSRSLASSFFRDSTLNAKVSLTDPDNSSNLNGTSGYPGSAAALRVFDFVNFLNFFRNWGIDGALTFPNSNQQGPWTAGTGRIWDWRLAANDTILLNKTGDGSSANQPYVAGAICPSASWGNKSATDQSGRTYLLNAMEIVDPFTSGYSNTGNHNGLCESNEVCIYTPNFGAYQGEGTLQPCTFVQNGGAVTGVTMYGYSGNGD